MALNPHRRNRHLIHLLIGALLTGALSACASLEVKPNYQPPQQKTIPSSKTVQVPFDQAWDGFVRNLSTSFFVVNTLSKESRLINISVGRGRANNFIDCGTANHTVNGEKWSFNPAKSATFDNSEFRSETVVEHRVSGNAGRMNIFVAPEGPNTVFEINTSYAVDMRQTGRAAVRNLFGRTVDSTRLPSAEASFEFTTKTSDQQALGNMVIHCQATGVWEQLILDLVPTT